MSDTQTAERSTIVKTRVLIGIMVVCGSLAGLLIWKANHRNAPPDEITDAVAIQRGFHSAAEREAVRRLKRKYLDDLYENSKLTSDDFEALQPVIDHGSVRAQIIAIGGLGSVSGADQHQKILSMLGDRPIPKDLRETWLSIFKDWALHPKDPTVMPMLKASKNPDVVKLSAEVANDKA